MDVRDPDAPRVVLEPFDLNGADTAVVDVRAVETLFQFSRPHADVPEGPRTRARNLAAAATAGQGVWILDVTEPARPRVLARMPAPPAAGAVVADVALGTIYELGSEGGAIPTRERDFVFALMASPYPALVLIDVTEPERPEIRGQAGLREGVRALQVARVYNAPFLQTFVLTVDPQGLQIVDVTRPTAPAVVASVGGVPLGRAIDLEEFPLDRAVDADGAPVLDVSHEGARWLSQAEALRVLGAPLIESGDAAPSAVPAGGGR